ncbi:MAG: serine/threonine-protein kinase [Myxococcales bacterium]
MLAGEFPRRFGSYVLLKPLARGGMGELDLAVTGGHGMEKLCVIKRVLPHLLVSDTVQRFREEASMMMRLSHGNLVGVLDAGREEGQFYLAMDFVEGKDLLATWNQCASRRVAFPVEIAAYVVKELARGLGYAHAYRDLRLVHRDISPANVLLSYSGEIKLTDFGLAISKLKEQQTAPGIIYGKLAYLAPEQARGQALDGRVDLYAAGILLWEMLTGQQLFPSRLPENPGSDAGKQNSTLDALERVRNPVVTPPISVTGRVPLDLNDIVMRALAVEPDDRYQTGEEMRADLGSFLARHAPATDAATLASFMALLFEEQIEEERTERDNLLRQSSALLSGPLTRAAAVPGPVPHIGTSHRANTGASALVDPALWDSTPGGADPGPATSALAQDSPAVTTVQRRRLVGDRRAHGGRAPADGEIVNGHLGDTRVLADVAAGAADSPAGFNRLAPPAADATALVPTSARSPFGAAPLSGFGKLPQHGLMEAHGADEDPRVGTTIAGRYFLRRLCGEGAMGRVYEGHHVEIGRRVAIKILHSNFRNTADVVERFRREARAASRIGHPNIVDVTDSGTTPDGAFFFVMEYLDGVDLEQVITREGALPVERALRLAAQVCRALVAAHTAGIIHRDLKPANVMLVRHRDEEDFVKVLDFGISKHSDLDIDPRGKNVGLTRPDAAVGTPIYMAPEQVAGYPSDGRTDVYAVGELLFEMLTGRQPFSGNDIIAVFNNKANEDPPPVRSLRPEVPEAIERMLVRAMSRLPAERQSTMAELKDEIMLCLTRVEAAPTQPGSPQRAADAAAARTGRVWRAPSRTIMIMVGGVVVGLGLASMVVLWRTDSSSPPAITAVASRARGPASSAALPSRAGAEPVNHPVSTVRPASLSAAVSSGIGASGLPTTLAAHRPTTARGTASRSEGGEMTGTGAAPVKRLPPLTAAARSGQRSAARPTPPAPSLSSSSAALASSDQLARGRAAFAKGHFPAAVRLGRASIAGGERVGGHLLLGDTFYKMERFADAVSEYDAALKLAPGNERARHGRELAVTHRAAP